MEGFSDHFWQLIDTADLVVVLRDRQRDTQNIRLLEGIFANSWYRHLSRDNYQWYGITHSIGNARDDICSTWSACH